MAEQATTPGIRLLGRVFLNGTITTLSGLHIGGHNPTHNLGGVDQTIVRNPLNGQPYIPGSTIKGKLRNLLEKTIGDPTRQRPVIGTNARERADQRCLLTCESESEYRSCVVSNLFGPSGPRAAHLAHAPTRVLVRDAPLSSESATLLQQSPYMELPYAEIKTEVLLDRLTSAASPRQIERVPAGARFDFSLIYQIFMPDTDPDWFRHLIFGLGLMESDTLGGGGSRGYGAITLSTPATPLTARLEAFNGVSLTVSLPTGAVVTTSETTLNLSLEYQQYQSTMASVAESAPPVTTDNATEPEPSSPNDQSEPQPQPEPSD